MTSKVKFQVRSLSTQVEEVRPWKAWASKCSRSKNSSYINQALSCPYTKVLLNKLVLLPEDEEKKLFYLSPKSKKRCLFLYKMS